MNRYQSCCGCCPLSTGCLILGGLGILYNLINLSGAWHDYKWLCIIAINIDGLLIAGVLQKNRFYMVPWMVYSILVNILLWVIAIVTLFFSSLISVAYEYATGDTISSISQKNEIAIIESLIYVFLFFFVLAAVIHALIIKVVFDHYEELRMEEQPNVQENVLPPHSSVTRSFSPTTTETYDASKSPWDQAFYTIPCYKNDLTRHTQF